MTENPTPPTDPTQATDPAQAADSAQPTDVSAGHGLSAGHGPKRRPTGAQPKGGPQRVDAAAMRRRSRIFRVVNVPMRAVLSLPFPTPLSRNLMLVRYTGRKSGRVYRQPLSYARDGAALLTPGGGRWTLNMEGGRPLQIRLRGRDVSARPELVREPGEVERLLDVIVAGEPAGRPLHPAPPPGRRPSGTYRARRRHRPRLRDRPLEPDLMTGRFAAGLAGRGRLVTGGAFP